MLHEAQISQHHAVGVVAGVLLAFVLSAEQGHPQVATNITSSGLNTRVAPRVGVGGETIVDITGGTRPGGGTNLFHSFGRFDVGRTNGVNDIANFVNQGSVDLAGNLLPNNLPTGNILARVTDPFPSQIYGTIQTTDFGGANLFLMNPAGVIFGPSATLNIGGMATFTTADYMRLTDGARFEAAIPRAQDALLSAADISAFGFLGPNVSSITVQGSQLSTPGISLIGGNISIQSGSGPARLSASGGQIKMASTASPGEFLHANLQPAPNVDGMSFTSSGSIYLAADSTIDVTGTSTVRIRGGQFVLSVNDAMVTTAVTPGAPDTVTLAQGSSIRSANAGADPGADIEVAAGNIQFNGSSVTSTTTGDGSGGGVTFSGESIRLINGSRILTLSDGFNFGAAGPIVIVAKGVDSVSLSGTDAVGLGSAIQSVSLGSGAGGGITIRGPDLGPRPDLILANGALIETGTQLFGPSGDISLIIRNLTATGGSGVVTYGSDFVPSGNISIDASGQIFLSGTGGGNASRIQNVNSSGFGGTGGISIDARAVRLENRARIESDTLFGFDDPTVTKVKVAATDSISLSGMSQINVLSNLTDVGALEISGRTLNVRDLSTITTSSIGDGRAGDVNIKITGSEVTLSNGGQINSRTEQGAGRAGDVTITIDGRFTATGVGIDEIGRSVPSGIFTSTTDVASGNAGLVKVSAGQVEISAGAALASSSAGTGGAGDININARNSFTMNNSSVTTEAARAGGGDITITTAPTGTVRLTNSTISASVADGPGGGGNISIDPQFVILQNSRILAQAAAGQGGNITITITNNGLFLPDATSVVNADSGSGINGTVTIQSPISQAGGKVVPLSSTPVETPALLGQRCAALASVGQYSSFVVAGRDTVPTEPGGWLVSPLAMSMIDGDRHPSASSGSQSPMVSLRRLQSAGPALWLPNGSAGCGS